MSSDAPNNTTGNTTGNTIGNIAKDRYNTIVSLLMSNNFNPFTMSPYSPLTANQGGDTHNPQVDTIRTYTNPTIEVLGNMNIATPYTFSINNQQIRPNQIADGTVTAAVNFNGSTTNSDFLVKMGGTDILTVMSTDATFQAYGGGPYTLNVVGQTYTSTLTVGPTITLPVSPEVVYILGNVKIDGSVSTTGSFDVSSLYITNNLDVSGQLNISGEYIYNNLDVSGQLNVSGEYIYNNLDVSGTIRATNVYIYNNLDVSGNTHITGNLDISGNLDVSGNINFVNVTVANAHITNRLGVSGELDLSGILQINAPFNTVTNDPALYVNGKSTFYNDVDISGGQLIVDATLAGNKYNTIQPVLVVNASAPNNQDAKFEVLGLSNFRGNVIVQDILDYRIQVVDVSATITDISDQPTMYVVDCGGSNQTIVLTGVTSSSLRVGVTYYFTAKNTGAGTLQITYKSLDGNVTTAGVPAPRLITLICVSYTGATNYFSAST